MFDEELKKKMEFICDSCNMKTTVLNENIKNIEYIELFRILVSLLKVFFFVVIYPSIYKMLIGVYAV